MTRKPAESQGQDKAQVTVPNTVVKGTNPGVGVSTQGYSEGVVLCACTWCHKTAMCTLWPRGDDECVSEPERMCTDCVYAADEAASDGR